MLYSIKESNFFEFRNINADIYIRISNRYHAMDDYTVWYITYLETETGAALQNHRKWKGEARNKREAVLSVCKSMTRGT